MHFSVARRKENRGPTHKPPDELQTLPLGSTGSSPEVIATRISPNPGTRETRYISTGETTTSSVATGKGKNNEYKSSLRLGSRSNPKISKQKFKLNMFSFEINSWLYLQRFC